MKKSRVFLGLGTLALLLTSIFATKANKKFAKFTGATIYISRGGATPTVLSKTDCVLGFSFNTTGSTAIAQLNNVYTLYGYNSAGSGSFYKLHE